MILQNKQLASLTKEVQSHKYLACTISLYLALDVIENEWDGSVLAEPRLTLSLSDPLHSVSWRFASVPCLIALLRDRNPEDPHPQR